MSDPVLIAIIGILSALVGGAVSPLITGFFGARGNPGRKAADRKINAETDNVVIRNLTDEINRLDRELEQERQANDGLRREVRAIHDEAEAARAEAGHARGQVAKHLERIEHLEGIIEAAGLETNGGNR